MPKVIALVNFRGIDFSEKYDEGKQYDFEQQRAETLAVRGLVKILEDTNHAKQEVEVEAPVKEEVANTTPNAEDVKDAEKAQEEVAEEAKADAETPKRGRPRKAE